MENRKSNKIDLSIYSGFFGVAVFVIGLLNIIFVHPVPGIVGIIISLIYLPITNPILNRTLGFSIPDGVKIVLGIAIIWFTLGVSDLGDMLDSLFTN